MGRKGIGTAFIGVSWALFALATGEPAPVVVQPSQYWEGDDGSWSTFSLRVGTPEQVVRVLVSTAWPNSVAVLNSSCPGSSSSSCASSRGGVFAPNSSSTWQEKGIFDLYQELNYTKAQDTAYFGVDSIGLGLDATEPKLQNQVLAAMETDNYYFGYLGIDPQPTNWTSNFTVQSPSFFKSLKTQGLIPSLTYSYTAGAPYRLKKVLGSLVFGGYDASRAIPNDLTFEFADDVSRDLVVAIQAIDSVSEGGASHDLLTESVLAFIDSTIPYFVLPYDVCEAFENAFGLVWNPKAGNGGLYTLSDTQHSNLLATNPNITFTLANSLSDGPIIQISLPYSAFDLEASFPLMNTTTRYFPLLRAANDTQITLGRAFLQEAMLIADYERGNFSLWPCTWEENAQQNIVTLYSADATGPGTPAAHAVLVQQQQARNLKLGLGVGLGVGIPLLAALAYLFFARRQRRWPFGRRAHRDSSKTLIAPTDTELDATSTPAEVETPDYRRTSMAKPYIAVHEAEAGYALTARSELAGSTHGPMATKAELEGYVPEPASTTASHSRCASNGVSTPISPRSNSTSTRPELTLDSLASSRPELPASESASPSSRSGGGGGSSNSGSRMIMELPGEPVPNIYLKSQSPARTPPRSPRVSARGLKDKEDLPPLPAGALDVDARMRLERDRARSSLTQQASTTGHAASRSLGRSEALGNAFGNASPRPDMPSPRFEHVRRTTASALSMRSQPDDAADAQSLVLPIQGYSPSLGHGHGHGQREGQWSPQGEETPSSATSRHMSRRVVDGGYF